MPVIRRVPEDYATIALAHTAADNGDIIYIGVQETLANVTITKAVHLIGAGGLDVSVEASNSFGVARNSGATSVAPINYVLSESNAASVPYLLLENLRVQQQIGNAATAAVRLEGVAPQGGLYVNRCTLSHTLNNATCYDFHLVTAGWRITCEKPSSVDTSKSAQKMWRRWLNKTGYKPNGSSYHPLMANN
jgi:hypothetical protein